MPEDKLILPGKNNLRKFENNDLNKLTKLIYHPIFGFVYKNRYRLATCLLMHRYDKILEIAFGPGLFIPTLSKRCNFVYGIDIQKEINKAEKILEKEGVVNSRLLNADIYGIPFKEKMFDLVVCLSLLEHLKELDGAIQEIIRVLKDTGEAIIGFPIKNKLTKCLFRLIGYNDEEIHPSGQSEILKSCQKVLKLEESILYPKILSMNYSLYFVGRFRKNCYA